MRRFEVPEVLEVQEVPSGEDCSSSTHRHEESVSVGDVLEII